MKKNNNSVKSIVNFLFEVGILSKTPRSGFYFLGSGEQSVAEHTNRVVFIGYVLASLEKDIDFSRVYKMCLFHDLDESRISDLNYVHQRYVNVEKERALHDIIDPIPFGQDIKATIDEYEERKSRESIIAKDADNIEWILSLKEQYDTGNTRALNWMNNAIKRLKTETAIKIAHEIATTDSNDWWDSNDGPAWVTEISKSKKK